MARARSDRPIPPRLPSDLPPASDLGLAIGTEIDHATIRGDFSDRDLEGLIVQDSHIVHCSFTAADLHRLRLVDVLVEESDFSGADIGEASFTARDVRGMPHVGCVAPARQIRDVRFSDVRLDGVNLRMAEGDRVLFDHVNLTRAELSAAQLAVACFFDSDLTEADISQARLPGARFHGSVLSELKGSEYLRDVVIDSTQVLPLARGILAGLHILVDDDRDTPLEGPNIGPTWR